MPFSFFSRRDILCGMTATAALAALKMPAIAADEPLRFECDYGVAVLPKPAQRVVSLGYTTQDTLLALEVVPLAIRDWYGDQPSGVWPWAQPYLKDAHPRLIKGAVSLELIATLKPDLIVAISSGITEAEYAGLSRIAPVLMQPKGVSTYGLPWDEMTLLIGRAVGKDRLAAELIARTRQTIATVRQRHPDWAGRTATAAYHEGGETGLFAPSDTRGHFLAELGFQLPPAAMGLIGPGGFYQKLSPEDLAVLEADLLLWVSASEDAGDLRKLPMRLLLKSHTEGREVFAGATVAAAISFGSVLSLPFAVTSLEADIAAALDGDPKTPVPGAVRAGIAP
ncbi:ABC transporter substrate-binding protein [Rhizobium sp. HT1-10]|uniref:ABC transporter substrate-binding protein n=1 Tax=Rhizobium sp. HT1-10 TaxID=3111638 RepID=UPI003C1C8F4E